MDLAGLAPVLEQVLEGVAVELWVKLHGTQSWSHPKGLPVRVVIACKAHDSGVSGGSDQGITVGRLDLEAGVQAGEERIGLSLWGQIHGDGAHFPSGWVAGDMAPQCLPKNLVPETDRQYRDTGVRAAQDPRAQGLYPGQFVSYRER